MAFYYVKSGGTAIGDAGRSETQRTGSFTSMGAANYYDSIYDVFAGGVPTTTVDIDYVIVSHLHIETHGSVNLGISSSTNYRHPKIFSVSDSDCQTYLKGAKVICTAGTLDITNAVNFKSGCYIKGVIFECLGSHFDTNNRYANPTFVECDIIGNSSTNLNHAKSVFIDCNISGKIFYGSQNIYIGGSQSITWSYNRGACAETEYHGVDLSASSGSSKFSYGNNLKLFNCKLFEFPPVKYGTYRSVDSVEYIGCDVAGNNHHYALHTFSGEAYTNDDIYLHYKYDDVNKSSLALNTDSRADLGANLKVKLCEIPAQDLSATDKTYRVNLLLDTATAATLSDSEFWVEVSHSDNATLALGKLVSSRNADILSSGTELTASAETWGGTLPTGNKAYQVDITLSSASLSNVTNTNVVVYVNLAVPNCDVYICPAVQIGT